jgi:hypothetical protein
MSRKDKDVEGYNEQILDALIVLLVKLGVDVKYDRGNFHGGLVKYEDNDYFYINRKEKTETKINTIVEELKNLKIPPEYIKGTLKPFFENTLPDKEN